MLGAFWEDRRGIIQPSEFILDGDGNPVKPGETGEIVVTDLDNYGMPLIRYRIGDRGKWSAGHPRRPGLPASPHPLPQKGGVRERANLHPGLPMSLSCICRGIDGRTATLCKTLTKKFAPLPVLPQKGNRGEGLNQLPGLPMSLSV